MQKKNQFLHSLISLFSYINENESSEKMKVNSEPLTFFKEGEKRKTRTKKKFLWSPEGSKLHRPRYFHTL